MKSLFRKYPRSCAFTATLIVCGVFGAMGQQFADNAKTQVGFIAWCVLQAVAILAFFGVVLYLGKNGAGDE